MSQAKTEKLINKLTNNVESYIKNNVYQFYKHHLDATELNKRYQQEKKDYQYYIGVSEKNTIKICFDGGLIWDLINLHYYHFGENIEDYQEDQYFCSETASKIFGLDGLEWEPYSSYRLDVYV